MTDHYAHITVQGDGFVCVCACGGFRFEQETGMDGAAAAVAFDTHRYEALGILYRAAGESDEG